MILLSPSGHPVQVPDSLVNGYLNKGYSLRTVNMTVSQNPIIKEPQTPAPTSVSAIEAEVDSRLRININTAEPEILSEIPGMGPSRIQSLIEAREKQKLEDINHLKQLGISVNWDSISELILLEF